MDFKQKLHRAFFETEMSDSDEWGIIEYLVQFDNMAIMGSRGEDIHPRDYYVGHMYTDMDEANRWAALKAGGRMWRLWHVDLYGGQIVEKGPWVTPEQAQEWLARARSRVN